MGAVPGGAFRTFCDPVYRMSIPVSAEMPVGFRKPKIMHLSVRLIGGGVVVQKTLLVHPKRSAPY